MYLFQIREYFTSVHFLNMIITINMLFADTIQCIIGFYLNYIFAILQ